MITFYILSLIISKYFVIDQLYFAFPVFRFYNLQTLFPVSLDNSHLSLLWKVVCNNAGCIYNQLFIEKLGFIYPYSDKIKILLFSLLVFCGSLFFIFYKNKKKHSNNSFNNELTPSKSSDLYSDFAPIDLGEDDDHYEQIKFALEDENVKNLAILGSFGSGKSSVINSFFKNKTVYGSKIKADEYVRVSFADFDYVNLNEEYPNNSQCRDNGKKPKEKVIKSKEKVIKSKEKVIKEDEIQKINNSKEKVIREDDIQNNDIKSNKLSLQDVEGEIVRQLFHSNLVKNNKFADVILSYPSKVDIFGQTFILFVLIIGIFCKPLRNSYYSLYSTSIYLFCFTSILFIPFLYLTISFFSKKIKLSKTSFGTVSVDFSEKNKLGVIDSYLNDIIYLFENSNCKFVILEDLDRTQNYEVFTHLRNLNFVLNNRLSSFAESRSQRSRIVFIYLLDDCIFSNPEELVKFFDYSVSIIPAVSATNAGQVFLNKRDSLNKCYFSNKILSDEFLLLISRFIPDIRLINKIFNDYLLAITTFEPILQLNECSDESELSDSQKQLIKFLFSFVVFRSFYPSEYHNLLIEKGSLYSILNRSYKNLEISSKVKDDDSILLRFSFKEFADNYKIDLPTFKKLFAYNSELLFNLLYRNYLTGCYRFFNSKPFKSSDNNQYLSSEAISYLLELYAKGDKYNPERSLHINEHFQVFFHYVPQFISYNKSILNFEFFEKLFEDDLNTDYVTFIRRYLVEILSGNFDYDGWAFIVDFVDYIFRHHVKNAQMKLAYSIFVHLFNSYDEVIDDKKSKNPYYCLEADLFNVAIQLFLTQKEQLSASIDEKNKILLLILLFLNSCYFEIKKISQQKGKIDLWVLVQEYLKKKDSIEFLRNNEILLSKNLFSSMRLLNVKFSVVPEVNSNFDSKYFFFKFLNLSVYREPNVQISSFKTIKCIFCFEPNGSNFISIARSISFLNRVNKIDDCDNSNNVRDCLLTVFLEGYIKNCSLQKNLKVFYCNLFYHIFVFKNYDLIFDLLYIYPKIREDRSPYLNDNLVLFLLFITFLNYYPTIERLSSNSYLSAHSLKSSLTHDVYVKNTNDVLSLCFSVSDAVTNQAALIRFLLILEQFQNGECSGSIRLYTPNNHFIKSHKSETTSSMHAVEAIKKLSEIFMKMDSNLISIECLSLSIIATFKNILDYENDDFDRFYKGKYAHYGIDIKKGKLRADIMNVVYIGQYIINVSEKEISQIRKVFSLSDSIYSYFDQCWTSLTHFYKSNYDQIFKSNSTENNICNLEPDLKKFNDDEEKIKSSLIQICRQARVSFF